MEDLHIGTEIRKRAKKKGMRTETMAKLLNVSTPNVYKIFERKSMDTDLLARVCEVLDFNFFTFYAKRFRTEMESDALDLCRMENSMLRDVLKEKDELYQILKMAKSPASASKEAPLKVAPAKAAPAKKGAPSKAGKKR
jgi:transcriptional regulator with XRE-family HTH domain